MSQSEICSETLQLTCIKPVHCSQLVWLCSERRAKEMETVRERGVLPWIAACPVQSGEPENATGMFAREGSVQREVHVRSTTPVCQSYIDWSSVTHPCRVNTQLQTKFNFFFFFFCFTMQTSEYSPPGPGRSWRGTILGVHHAPPPTNLRAEPVPL